MTDTASEAATSTAAASQTTVQAEEQPERAPTPEERAESLRELGRAMKAEQDEDDSAHVRWSDREASRNVRERFSKEPASEGEGSDPAQPGGTEPAKDAKAEPAKDDAKADDKKPEAEDRGALARKHEREIRSRDRLIEQHRSELATVTAKNQELTQAVDLVNQDPLKFLVSRGVDLQRLAQRLVEEQAETVLGKPPDPRELKIKELEDAVNELRGSKKQQDEQSQAQQEKARQDNDWRAATDYVVTRKDEFPFINALGHEGVNEAIQAFYEFNRSYPDDARRLGNECWSHVVKATEGVLAERERERYSRLSTLIGGPASAPPAGDGQKKPAAATGQKRTQGSRTLSSDGSTPAKGTRKPAAAPPDEDLEDRLERLMQQRMALRARPS